MKKRKQKRVKYSNGTVVTTNVGNIFNLEHETQQHGAYSSKSVTASRQFGNVGLLASKFEDSDKNESKTIGVKYRTGSGTKINASATKRDGLPNYFNITVSHPL